jgi:hypothetical protein
VQPEHAANAENGETFNREQDQENQTRCSGQSFVSLNAD